MIHDVLVDEPMYPMKKLCRDKMYVLSTALNTIVFSTVSMLLWLSCMRRDFVLYASTWERTAIVDFAELFQPQMGKFT